MSSDIYALCEAFPQSYAEQLYSETQTLLETFVAGLCQVGEIPLEGFGKGGGGGAGVPCRNLEVFFDTH